MPWRIDGRTNLNLTLHHDGKEENEINHKNWPENWDVKEGDKRADDAYKHGYGGTMPERKKSITTESQYKQKQYIAKNKPKFSL